MNKFNDLILHLESIVFRYLANDKKNSMHKLTKRVMKRLGIMGPTEEFNSEELKSKIIFYATQGIYSIVVCIPTMWLYSNYYTRYIEKEFRIYG